MKYAVRISYTGPIPPTPAVGYALDGCKVLTRDTPEDAEREARRIRRDGRYSWRDCRVEAVEYKEGKR